MLGRQIKIVGTQIKIIGAQIDRLVYDPHHPTKKKTQAVT